MRSPSTRSRSLIAVISFITVVSLGVIPLLSFGCESASGGGRPTDGGTSGDVTGDATSDVAEDTAGDAGGEVAADATSDTATNTATDAASGCNGDAPGCPSACGSDALYAPATCKAGAWVCDKGVLSTSCPKPGPSCVGTSTTSLPGASIVFPLGPCTATVAEAAAGLTITYQVVISKAIEGVVALPKDAGQCGKPDASGLIPFAIVEGGGQKWCICDTGLCMGLDETPVKLAVGTFNAGFSWHGVNWFGPSDTGNPKGAPFPVGTYTVKVTASGKRLDAKGAMVAFEVVGTRPLVLTP